MQSAPAITFDYRPSRWLLAAGVLVAALALLALVLSGVPAIAKMALGVFVCSQVGMVIGHHLRPAVRRAAWQQAGHWRLTDSQGREHVAELARSVVRGMWIVLNLRRSDGKRVVLILAPDNTDADTQRRLRVRLSRVQEPVPAA